MKQNSYFILNFTSNSIQLQLSQPKDKLTEEEVTPYLTVSIFDFYIFYFFTKDYFLIGCSK